jgi:uncharacterized membrane protein YphA (DoxX/SURF4 family)
LTRPRLYAPFTNPAIVPTLTFFVEYGHLLIGLSLISGLLVRVSAPFAVMLMLLYWTAHMDFPYIENANNYLTSLSVTPSADGVTHTAATLRRAALLARQERSFRL